MESTLNHDELNINTEEAATLDAVNLAAREPLESDDTPLVHGCDTITLADGEPDLSITIDADESESRYLYSMHDSASTMTHNAAGPLIGAEAKGLLLYALTASLQSILHGRILERLCLRYGYRTKASALASRMQLIITIGTTDAELLAVGKVITQAIELNVLSFLAPSLTVTSWDAVTPELSRFEVRWELIPTDATGLTSLRTWAEAVLVGCPHSGPVYSPERRLAA